MKHIAWARENSRAQHAAKAVLLVLASAADDTTNECFPSIATIARWAGVGRTSVFSALQRLEELGELECKERAGRATIYALTLREPVQYLNPSGIRTGSNIEREVSKIRTPPVQNLNSTRPDSEPIKSFKELQREKPIVEKPLTAFKPTATAKAPPKPISDEAYKMLGNTFVAPEPAEITAGELWRSLKRECELQLPHGIYYHFCDDRIQVLGLEDDTLRVRVASDGAYKTLTGRIESVINRIATSIAGRPVQVCFEQEYQPLDVLLGVNR